MPPSKRRVVSSLFIVVLLVLALPVGVYLSGKRQIYKSKATSAGDCRCSGNSIICEVDNGDGTTRAEWKGDDPSCTQGTPPSFTKNVDENTGEVTTTIESINIIGSNAGITAKPQESPTPVPAPAIENVCFLPEMNCVGDDWVFGVELAKKPASALKDNKNPALIAKLKEQIKDPNFAKNNPDVVNALTESDPSLKQTVGTQTTTPISSQAMALRDAKTKECSLTLGLCPMIDPKTLEVVGWVPSDKAVFGTFAEAIVARSGLSIGETVKEITIGTTKYFVTDFNFKLDVKPEDVAGIKKLADQQKVDVDASGKIIIDPKRYDLAKIQGQLEAYSKQQEEAENAIAKQVLSGDKTNYQYLSPATKKQVDDQLKVNAAAEAALKGNNQAKDKLPDDQQAKVDELVKDSQDYQAKITSVAEQCVNAEDICQKLTEKFSQADKDAVKKAVEAIVANRKIVEENRQKNIDIVAMQIAALDRKDKAANLTDAEYAARLAEIREQGVDPEMMRLAIEKSKAINKSVDDYLTCRGTGCSLPDVISEEQKRFYADQRANRLANEALSSDEIVAMQARQELSLAGNEEALKLFQEGVKFEQAISRFETDQRLKIAGLVKLYQEYYDNGCQNTAVTGKEDPNCIAIKIDIDKNAAEKNISSEELAKVKAAQAYDLAISLAKSSSGSPADIDLQLKIIGTDLNDSKLIEKIDQTLVASGQLNYQQLQEFRQIKNDNFWVKFLTLADPTGTNIDTRIKQNVLISDPNQRQQDLNNLESYVADRIVPGILFTPLTIVTGGFINKMDPKISEGQVLTLNTLSAGALKRGNDELNLGLKEKDAIKIVRGAVIQGAAPAALAVAIVGAPMIIAVAPVSLVAGGTLLSTTAGIAAATHSLQSTAEVCTFEANMNGYGCALSAANSAFMIASAGIGVAGGAPGFEAAMQQGILRAALANGEKTTIAILAKKATEAEARALIPPSSLFQKIALGNDIGGTLVFSANAREACFGELLPGQSRDYFNCGMSSAMAAMSGARLFTRGVNSLAGKTGNENLTKLSISADKKLGFTDFGLNTTQALVACGSVITGKSTDLNSCTTNLAFATTSYNHVRDIHQLKAEVSKPGASSQDIANKIAAGDTNPELHIKLLDAVKAEALVKAREIYLLETNFGNKTEQQKALEKARQEYTTDKNLGNLEDAVLAAEMSSKPPAERAKFLSDLEARINLLQAQYDIATKETIPDPDLLLTLSQQLQRSQNLLARSESFAPTPGKDAKTNYHLTQRELNKVESEIVDLEAKKAANQTIDETRLNKLRAKQDELISKQRDFELQVNKEFNRTPRGIATQLLEFANLETFFPIWGDLVMQTVSGKTTEERIITSLKFDYTSDWSVTTNNKKFEPKVRQVVEKMQELEGKLGKKLRGAEAGNKNQVEIIAKAILGDESQLYRAVTGLGKSAVVLPMITVAKAEIANKPVLTLLQDPGKVKEYLKEIIPNKESQIDALDWHKPQEALVRDIEAALKTKLGHDFVILTGDFESRLASANPNAILIASPDVIFNQITDNTSAKRLMTFLKNGVLVADEAHQTLLANTDYVVSQGQGIHLAGTEYEKTFMDVWDKFKTKTPQEVTKEFQLTEDEHGRFVANSDKLTEFTQGMTPEQIAATKSILDILGKSKGNHLKEDGGRPALAYQNNLTGRTPSDPYDALALEVAGRKVLGMSSEPRLHEVVINPKSLSTNYGLFLRVFSQIIGVTGTPEQVTNQFRFAYGINLRASSAGVDTTFNPNTILSRLANKPIRDFDLDFDDGQSVAHEVWAFGLVTSDILAGRIALASQDTVIVRFADGHAEYYENKVNKGNITKEAINEKITSGNVLQIYEYGAHQGTDAKTQAGNKLRIFINEKTTLTEFIQAVGRGRDGGEELEIVWFGEKKPANYQDMMILLSNNDNQAIRLADLAALKRGVDNLVPDTIEKMRALDLESLAAKDPLRAATINKYYDELLIGHKVSTGSDSSLRSERISGYQEIADALTRTKQALQNIKNTQDPVMGWKASRFLDGVLTWSKNSYTETDLRAVRGEAKRSINDIRTLNSLALEAGRILHQDSGNLALGETTTTRGVQAPTTQTRAAIANHQSPNAPPPAAPAAPAVGNQPLATSRENLLRTAWNSLRENVSSLITFAPGILRNEPPTAPNVPTVPALPEAANQELAPIAANENQLARTATQINGYLGSDEFAGSMATVINLFVKPIETGMRAGFNRINDYLGSQDLANQSNPFVTFVASPFEAVRGVINGFDANSIVALTGKNEGQFNRRGERSLVTTTITQDLLNTDFDFLTIKLSDNNFVTFKKENGRWMFSPTSTNPPLFRILARLQPNPSQQSAQPPVPPAPVAPPQPGQPLTTAPAAAPVVTTTQPQSPITTMDGDYHSKLYKQLANLNKTGRDVLLIEHLFGPEAAEKYKTALTEEFTLARNILNGLLAAERERFGMAIGDTFEDEGVKYRYTNIGDVYSLSIDKAKRNIKRRIVFHENLQNILKDYYITTGQFPEGSTTLNEFIIKKTTDELIEDFRNAFVEEYANKMIEKYFGKYLAIKNALLTAAQQPASTTQTTSPVTTQLAECVTGNTLLKRRKRKKGKNIWEDVRIDQIQEGDEILSLDEETGRFVPASVRKLLAKGVQNTWKLVTVSGKSIETTSEHPYLVSKLVKPKPSVSTVFEVDQSFRIEDMTHDTVISLANSDTTYSLKISKKDKLILAKYWQSKNRRNMFGVEAFALAVRYLANRYPTITRLIIDREYDRHELSIANIIRQNNQNLSVNFLSIGKSSPAHIAAYYLATGKSQTSLSGQQKRILANSILKGFLASELLHPEFTGIRNSHDPFVTNKNTTVWQKVKNLRPGAIVATTNGWEKIAHLYPTGRKLVYDIEIENTHNFIGNGIVAHNTTTTTSIKPGVSPKSLPDQIADSLGTMLRIGSPANNLATSLISWSATTILHVTTPQTPQSPLTQTGLKVIQPVANFVNDFGKEAKKAGDQIIAVAAKSVESGVSIGRGVISGFDANSIVALTGKKEGLLQRKQDDTIPGLQTISQDTLNRAPNNSILFIGKVLAQVSQTIRNLTQPSQPPASLAPAVPGASSRESGASSQQPAPIPNAEEVVAPTTDIKLSANSVVDFVAETIVRSGIVNENIRPDTPLWQKIVTIYMSTFFNPNFVDDKRQKIGNKLGIQNAGIIDLLRYLDSGLNRFQSNIGNIVRPPLEVYASKALKRLKQRYSKVVFYGDLNQVKAVNDISRENGDAYFYDAVAKLHELAQKAGLTDYAIVRVGGDEFAVLATQDAIINIADTSVARMTKGGQVNTPAFKSLDKNTPLPEVDENQLSIYDMATLLSVHPGQYRMARIDLLGAIKFANKFGHSFGDLVKDFITLQLEPGTLHFWNGSDLYVFFREEDFDESWPRQFQTKLINAEKSLTENPAIKDLAALRIIPTVTTSVIEIRNSLLDLNQIVNRSELETNMTWLANMVEAESYANTLELLKHNPDQYGAYILEAFNPEDDKNRGKQRWERLLEITKIHAPTTYNLESLKLVLSQASAMAYDKNTDKKDYPGKTYDNFTDPIGMILEVVQDLKMGINFHGNVGGNQNHTQIVVDLAHEYVTKALADSNLGPQIRAYFNNASDEFIIETYIEAAKYHELGNFFRIEDGHIVGLKAQTHPGAEARAVQIMRKMRAGQNIQQTEIIANLIWATNPRGNDLGYGILFGAEYTAPLAEKLMAFVDQISTIRYETSLSVNPNHPTLTLLREMNGQPHTVTLDHKFANFLENMNTSTFNELPFFMSLLDLDDKTNLETAIEVTKKFSARSITATTDYNALADQLLQNAQEEDSSTPPPPPTDSENIPQPKANDGGQYFLFQDPNFQPVSTAVTSILAGPVAPVITPVITDVAVPPLLELISQQANLRWLDLGETIDNKPAQTKTNLNEVFDGTAFEELRKKNQDELISSLAEAAYTKKQNVLSTIANVLYPEVAKTLADQRNQETIRNLSLDPELMRNINPDTILRVVNGDKALATIIENNLRTAKPLWDFMLKNKISASMPLEDWLIIAENYNKFKFVYDGPLKTDSIKRAASTDVRTEILGSTENVDLENALVNKYVMEYLNKMANEARRKMAAIRQNMSRQEVVDILKTLRADPILGILMVEKISSEIQRVTQESNRGSLVKTKRTNFVTKIISAGTAFLRTSTVIAALAGTHLIYQSVNTPGFVDRPIDTVVQTVKQDYAVTRQTAKEWILSRPDPAIGTVVALAEEQEGLQKVKTLGLLVWDILTGTSLNNIVGEQNLTPTKIAPTPNQIQSNQTPTLSPTLTPTTPPTLTPTLSPTLTPTQTQNPDLTKQKIIYYEQIPQDLVDEFNKINNYETAGKFLKKLPFKYLVPEVNYNPNTGVETVYYRIPPELRKSPNYGYIVNLSGQDLKNQASQQIPDGVLAISARLPSQAISKAGPFVWSAHPYGTNLEYGTNVETMYNGSNYPELLLMEFQIVEKFPNSKSAFRPTDRLDSFNFIGEELQKGAIANGSTFLSIDKNGQWSLDEYPNIPKSGDSVNLIWSLNTINSKTGKREFNIPINLYQQQKAQLIGSIQLKAKNDNDSFSAKFVGPSIFFRYDLKSNQKDIVTVPPFLYIQTLNLNDTEVPTMFKDILLSTPLPNGSIANPDDLIIATGDLHYVSNGDINGVMGKNATKINQTGTGPYPNILSRNNHTAVYIGIPKNTTVSLNKPQTTLTQIAPTQTTLSLNPQTSKISGDSRLSQASGIPSLFGIDTSAVIGARPDQIETQIKTMNLSGVETLIVSTGYPNNIYGNGASAVESMARNINYLSSNSAVKTLVIVAEANNPLPGKDDYNSGVKNVNDYLASVDGKYFGGLQVRVAWPNLTASDLSKTDGIHLTNSGVTKFFNAINEAIKRTYKTNTSNLFLPLSLPGIGGNIIGSFLGPIEPAIVHYLATLDWNSAVFYGKYFIGWLKNLPMPFGFMVDTAKTNNVATLKEAHQRASEILMNHSGTNEIAITYNDVKKTIFIEEGDESSATRTTIGDFIGHSHPRHPESTAYVISTLQQDTKNFDLNFALATGNAPSPSDLKMFLQQMKDMSKPYFDHQISNYDSGIMVYSWSRKEAKSKTGSDYAEQFEMFIKNISNNEHQISAKNMAGFYETLSKFGFKMTFIPVSNQTKNLVVEFISKSNLPINIDGSKTIAENPCVVYDLWQIVPSAYAAENSGFANPCPLASRIWFDSLAQRTVNFTKSVLSGGKDPGDDYSPYRFLNKTTLLATIINLYHAYNSCNALGAKVYAGTTSFITDIIIVPPIRFLSHLDFFLFGSKGHSLSFTFSQRKHYSDMVDEAVRQYLQSHSGQKVSWTPSNAYYADTNKYISVLGSPIDDDDMKYITGLTPQQIEYIKGKNIFELQTYFASQDKNLPIDYVDFAHNVAISKLLKLNPSADTVESNIRRSSSMLSDTNVQVFESLRDQVANQAKIQGSPVSTSQILTLLLERNQGDLRMSMAQLSDFFKYVSRSRSINFQTNSKANVLWVKNNILDEYSYDYSFNKLEYNPLEDTVIKPQDEYAGLFGKSRVNFDASLRNRTGEPYHVASLGYLLAEFPPEVVAFLVAGEYVKFGPEHGLQKTIVDISAIGDLYNLQGILEKYNTSDHKRCRP